MTESHAWNRKKFRKEIRRAMPGNPKSARTKLSVGELWRIVDALGGERPPSHLYQAQETMDEPEIRRWIADELSFEYDPDGYVRPFNNAELVQIRDALQEVEG